MKTKTLIVQGALCMLITQSFIFQSCKNNPANDGNSQNISEMRNLEGEELIDRGKYLVTFGGCNDCHSPKMMTPQGPVDDTTRQLSGHPANIPLSAFPSSALKPGSYALAGPDMTMWIGPWGISYTANLTPDSTSGIGAWDAETFMRTLRTGKHLGQADGRSILPPMPWMNYAKANDEDLKAIFAYLKSLPPISNKVPAPVPPDEATKLATN